MNCLIAYLLRKSSYAMLRLALPLRFTCTATCLALKLAHKDSKKMANSFLAL
ncbi:MAG: hypothetical protein LBL94_07925 [Prevotellaceae bacterium]|nr:hypothetical protein [Prevotellaceae bacterium]